MNESWDIDRKPTATERWTGIVAASLLCIAGGTALWFSSVVLGNLWASLATGAFTAASAFLLFRFIFTGGQKLQRSGIIKMAIVFSIVGFVTLIGSIFVEDLRDKLMLLFLGVSGIGGGILNFSKTKKVSNHAPEKNAEDVT